MVNCERNGIPRRVRHGAPPATASNENAGWVHFLMPPCVRPAVHDSVIRGSISLPNQLAVALPVSVRSWFRTVVLRANRFCAVCVCVGRPVARIKVCEALFV